MLLAGDVKGIHDTLRQQCGKPQEAKFGVEKCHVEVGVVNDERGIPDEVEKIPRNSREDGFVLQKCSRQAMYGLSLLGHVAFRVDVDMERLPGWQMIHEFDGADLDNAVAIGRIKPGRLGIEYDFTQQVHWLTFLLTSAMTRSTSRAVSARFSDVSIT